jgi:hypothetical protein
VSNIPKGVFMSGMTGYDGKKREVLPAFDVTVFSGVLAKGVRDED